MPKLPANATVVSGPPKLPDNATVVVSEHTRRRGGAAQAVAQSFVENLPAMGGAAGGLVGAIPGAAVGGTVGQAAKLALSPIVGLSDVLRPPPVSEQFQSLIRAGAEQAGYEAGGKILAAGTKLAGRTLMRAALAPTRALRQEFPQLARTATEEARTMVGARPVLRLKGGTPTLQVEGGTAKVDALRRASSASEDDMLRIANANGVRIPVQDIAQPLIQNADDYAFRTEGRHLSGQEAASILGTVRRYVSDKLARQGYGSLRPNINLLTPEQTQVLKQEAQREVRPLFKARRAGVVPAGNPDLAAAVEQSSRQALHSRIPGLQEQAGKTQRLIGLKRAVLQREVGEPLAEGGRELASVGGRTAAYGTLAALGGGVGYSMGGTPTERIQRGLEGAGLGFALGSPQVLSLAALGLTDPMFLQLLAQTPRAIGPR